jgi:hypothetical protein
MNRRSLLSPLLVVSALAITLVASSAARADTPYHPGDGIPYGYHVEEERHLGLIIGGATTFAVTYSFSAAIGASTKEPIGFIPVGGAFYAGALAFRGCGDRELGGLACFAGGLAIVDGLAQTAGLIMLSVGAARSGDLHLVENKTASLRVAPMPMPGGGGLLATGTF